MKACDHCGRRASDTGTCYECRQTPCNCPPFPGFPRSASPDDIWMDDEPAGTPADSLISHLKPGGCILDVPAMPASVWGTGEDILWAKGQSLIIAGPDGVGKTTLAGNLVQARLGLGKGGEVLGLTVTPGERNVLVLLMDRPAQAMAALARLFTEEDREVLDARLRVWRGPPPEDLARNTGMLAHLCMLAGADTCLIDSLKDAALKLSDDETGSGWNRARQFAIEAGTELVELHHPRKGQEGNRKPASLDDLYGSRFIPAGAGSVISLWGQAGDPVVELSQIKPITVTVGPLEMAIDGTSGLVSVGHQVDLVEQVRLRGTSGLTAADAAKLLNGTEKPTKAQIEKARRKLDRKVTEGVLVRMDGQRGGGVGRAGGSEGRTDTAWFPATRINHGINHGPSGPGSITESITEQTRAGQNNHAQPMEEQSRGGGGIYIPPSVIDPGPPAPGKRQRTPKTAAGPCPDCGYQMTDGTCRRQACKLVRKLGQATA